MTRQLDVQNETRETARRLSVIKALEFELVGNLASQGNQLHGFSIRILPSDVLLTLRATTQRGREVSFVGSDTMMNCILKATYAAKTGGLKWRVDRYSDPQN